MAGELAVSDFGGLNLSEERLAAIETLGWTDPTPIQEKAIPHALEGKDVVGIAQTGTGKTGAFMIPALERIEVDAGLQILVLCPTRELAQQVDADTKALCRGTKIRSAVIHGGVSYEPQNTALREGYEVIAATPGRFIDHLKRGTADLSHIRTFTLDEADRLLDMGFRPQIEEVLDRLPRQHQTMLFSATMPHGVHDLSLRITEDALWVEAAPSGTVAEGIDEQIYMVKPEKKPDLLLHLLGEPGWDQVLVFSRTKAGADALQARLKRESVPTAVMHGDRAMKQRVRALDRFATGDVRVLVATDVAQRGLDVEGISHVVNYDIPLDPEDYVHRIGRTGRMGAVGMAVTFVTSADLGYLKSLQYHLGRELKRISLEGYGYAGGAMRDERSERRHGRAGRGVGSRLDEDLSEEELKRLLQHGGAS